VAGVWAAAGVAVALGVAPLISPSAGASPEFDEFSVERAMHHVTEIARVPHPIGSEASVRVRDYLVDQLSSLDLDPELQSVTVPDYFGEPGGTVDVVNVMARMPGDAPTKAVVLMAHYDSVPTTYGANDNAVGVAAILETARLLAAGPPLRNDVILLFTDGEEPAPRFGSTAFLERHPWASDVGFVVNFEAIGGSGPAMLVETNGPETWVVDGLKSEGGRPVAFSFLPATVELIGEIGTDFDPFAAQGIPGIHVAYVRGSPIYHTFRDSVERVSESSLVHHGSYAVSLARHFGQIDLTFPWDGDDAVYFTVGRWLLPSYPADVARPLAILVVALFGISVVRRVGRSETSLRALSAGAAVVVVRLLAGVVLATLVWKVLAGLRRSPGVVESYLYLIGLLALCGAIGLATLRGRRRPRTRRDSGGGIVLIWVALAVATAWLMPGASYLFAWPALVGSIALIPPPLAGGLRVAVVSAVSVPTAVLVLPAVETFFQFAQPRPGNPGSEMVETVAVALLLAVLAAGLVASQTVRQRSSNTVITPE
jgi:hypothetical protein